VSAWAILAAAGQGVRLGAGAPKALRPLAGVPMLAHSLTTLAKAPSVVRIVVAAPAGWEDRVAEVAAQFVPDGVGVVPGGATRADSVRAALGVVPVATERVVVHDAARPLADVALVEAALAALDRADGAVCAVPVSDTLKQVSGDHVLATIDRSVLWRAQTPQAFRAGALRRAHERADAGDVDVTDDAVLLERAGASVVVVAGDERNMKVTTPADFALAEALLEAR
jgi:2-C-methyl-D-erythritol 4-phosphate cytidylyltransferase